MPSNTQTKTAPATTKAPAQSTPSTSNGNGKGSPVFSMPYHGALTVRALGTTQDTAHVIRVAGGWLYTPIGVKGATTVFVPFSRRSYSNGQPSPAQAN